MASQISVVVKPYVICAQVPTWTQLWRWPWRWRGT